MNGAPRTAAGVPRLGVAPRFHLPVDWVERVRLGSGLQWREGILLPRGPWRTTTAEEAAALGEGPEPAAAWMLTLPHHLADRWWGLLQRRHEAGSGPLVGFDEFSRAVCEFLAFKQVPIPDLAVCDLLVGAPGQAAVRLDGGGGVGLACNVPAATTWPAGDGAPLRPRLVVNLGEDPAAVLLGGPLPDRREDLAGEVNAGPPRTFGDLAGAVVQCGAAGVPLRLELRPGEGILLSAGLLVGGCTEGREEPDVLLSVRDPE